MREPPRGAKSKAYGTGENFSLAVVLQTGKLVAMNLTKRRVLWVTCVLLITGAVLAVCFSAPKEPVYEGRRLSVWIDIANEDMDGFSPATGVAAIQSVGTNSLSWLLNEARVADSQLTYIRFWMHEKWPRSFAKPTTADERVRRANTGFAILGDAALSAVPELVKLLEHPDPKRSSTAMSTLLAVSGAADYHHEIYRMAATTLSNLNGMARSEVFSALLRLAADTNALAGRTEAVGSLSFFRDEARRSAPVLTRSLRDSESSVRVISASSLGRLAREPVAVIPELIGALDDPSIEVRRSAAWALGQFYRQAKTAVPRLLEARRDPDLEVRKVANESLDKIEPETSAAIPDLPAFKP